MLSPSAAAPARHGLPARRRLRSRSGFLLLRLAPVALLLACGANSRSTYGPSDEPVFAHALFSVERATNRAGHAAFLPDDELDARSELARLLLDEGESSAALPHLHALQIARPFWWTFHFALAEALYRATADAVGAIEHLDACIDVQPEGAPCFELRAMIREDSGDSAGAIADYEAALGFSPDLPLASERLARLYLAAGRTGEADRLLDRLREMSGDSVDLRILAGLIDERAGHVDEAEAHYQWVADHHRDRAMGATWLMRFYERTGRSEEAAEWRVRIERWTARPERRLSGL